MGKKNIVNQSSKSKVFKFNFKVRSAFPTEVLPFGNRPILNLYSINDCVPTVNTLEKNKVYQQRNFGTTPVNYADEFDVKPNFVSLEINGEKYPAYEKRVHILDAYRFMRYGEVYPSHQWNLLWSQYDQPQLVDIHNQAYVDATASFLVGSLSEQLGTPHFAKFYQAFRAVAKLYKYNITEDVSSYRYSNWFWQAFDKNYFTIEMYEKDSEKILSDEEVLNNLRPEPELCYDSDDSDDSSPEDSLDLDNKSHLTDIDCNEVLVDDDIVSADISVISEDEKPILHHFSNNSRNGKDTDSNETDETDYGNYMISAILKDMPVVVFHTERMDGMMDSLLDEENFEGEWELRWTAWIFQIVVALNQIQHAFSLIHNDLHTNNILWKNTDVEFYFYKDSKGQIFKIPTFGKRFVIIDFGRAVFTLNGVEIISSDFNEGHDAEGQYNYGSIRDHDYSVIRPNTSFDLVRLSCSLTNVLFPEHPEQKKSGSILSKEKNWIVRETTSQLFNMLWSWLIDDKGENILETQDGQEKYPGFDLYQHIAEHCKKARPDDWITNSIFSQFHSKHEETQKESYIPIL
jgi:hypothetical protein